MKKQALGKGLKAYLSDEYTILKDDRFAELDIELLKPNPHQPRQEFNKESLEELSRSIRDNGVLQPILVVPENDHYKIVIGERRWRASQQAGLKKVPVLIRNLEANKQIEASLIENIQRDDLNPLEIAQAYQKMIDELKYTQAGIAERVGKDRVSVTNYLRLLKLPEKIKQFISSERLSMGHARALLALETAQEQESLAHEIIQKKLSVRETEKAIKRQKKKSPEVQKTKADPDLAALEERFTARLGTKTAISGTPHKGIIKIHFHSLDDLNRIFDLIKGD